MDPNTTLEELRELAREWFDSDNDHAAQASDLFNALDGWLSRGGFLPKAWERQ